MLTVAPDRPVDPLIVTILRAIAATADELGISYFLVGATARDILLGHVFGLKPGRATRDADFAFAIEHWDQFDAIKNHLIATGQFVSADQTIHRLRFGSGSDNQRFIVDLIPFGGLEQPPHFIAWPPDMKILMNVAGYGDALRSALLVDIEPGLTTRVASLPGLALLKLFAWSDRGHSDPKDAIDFVTILRSYTDAGNQNRVYSDAAEALESAEFDVEIAGAWLLGRDIMATISNETHNQLLALVNDAGRVERLALDMARALRHREDSVSYSELLLGKFTQGLNS